MWLAPIGLVLTTCVLGCGGEAGGIPKPMIETPPEIARTVEQWGEFLVRLDEKSVSAIEPLKLAVIQSDGPDRDVAATFLLSGLAKSLQTNNGMMRIAIARELTVIPRYLIASRGRIWYRRWVDGLIKSPANSDAYQRILTLSDSIIKQHIDTFTGPQVVRIFIESGDSAKLANLLTVQNPDQEIVQDKRVADVVLEYKPQDADRSSLFLWEGDRLLFLSRRVADVDLKEIHLTRSSTSVIKVSGIAGIGPEHPLRDAKGRVYLDCERSGAQSKEQIVTDACIKKLCDLKYDILRTAAESDFRLDFSILGGGGSVTFGAVVLGDYLPYSIHFMIMNSSMKLLGTFEYDGPGQVLVADKKPETIYKEVWKVTAQWLDGTSFAQDLGSTMEKAIRLKKETSRGDNSRKTAISPNVDCP